MKDGTRTLEVAYQSGNGSPEERLESKKARATRARTVKGVPTCVSLFAGGGGLDLGFEQAGFRVLAATDFEPAAADTYAKNWPDVPFLLTDIRKLKISELHKALKGRRPDVVIGGPPCQGFSTLGDRLSADPRNNLVDDFVRIVGALKPQAVVVENVRAIVTEYKGRYRDYVIERLTEVGYHVFFDVLDAASYGVPQHRKRALFVGFLGPRIGYAFPDATHGPDADNPYSTVGQAISDLMDKGPEVANHIPLRHTARVIGRYELIPEGGMLPPPDQLPPELRRKNFGSTYKRLHRERPSLTIVPGNNALPVHPVLHRSLTPREAARLQGFPDRHLFAGNRRQQCKLAGNAVPPPLARVIAESVASRILPLRGSRAKLAKQDGAAGPIVVRARPRVDAVASLTKPTRGFVDLFCGAGGFSLGLAQAGLRPLVAADLNDKVRATHELNHPETPFVHGDLSLPATQDLIVQTAGAEPFAVVGGPPCQGFSVFGKRRLSKNRTNGGYDDPRNRLVLSFVDTVAKLRPRWVIMENVAGFATMKKGAFVRAVVEELTAQGFTTIEHRVLDAANFGVPQRRKRFLLIANRTGHVIPWPKPKFFEEPRSWQKPFRTVGEAISDLATEESLARFTCHVPMNHRPLQVARYSHIPEGGKLDLNTLPDELKKGYRTDKVKNFSHVFKRLHRDRPATTMVPGHNAFPIHPWLNRSLTVREAARLQTIPDEIEFVGARQDQCIQVGNAFPPLLAELLANYILRAESSGWYPGQVKKSAMYSLLDLGDNDAPVCDEDIRAALAPLGPRANNTKRKA